MKRRKNKKKKRDKKKQNQNTLTKKKKKKGELSYPVSIISGFLQWMSLNLFYSL